MTRPEVTYVRDGQVATITLHDPEHRNALSGELRRGLWAALRRFSDDSAGRIAILTGAGDLAFCAGADLGELGDEEIRVPPPDYLPILGRNLAVGDKIVICAVNGVAYGGGFLLAQSADLVVAAEHARFGLPEVRVGRGAPWSVPLSRMVSQRIWLELLITGEDISAARAYEIGFVNRIVAAEDLLPATRALAERILAGAPATVAASKRIVTYAAEMGRTAAWDVADTVFEHLVYRHADAMEGPRAFIERRPPEWTARLEGHGERNTEPLA